MPLRPLLGGLLVDSPAVRVRALARPRWRRPVASFSRPARVSRKASAITLFVSVLIAVLSKALEA
jgi:hypothetical protein